MLLADTQSAHIWARARYRAWQTLWSHPDPRNYNNLHRFPLACQLHYLVRRD
jgi:hypothetical protein